jgi:hypothetical protein
MRKRLITPTPETVRSRAEGWLDVERAAIVEITSEEKDFPVESISFRERRGAGARRNRGLKRFDSCLTSRKN